MESDTGPYVSIVVPTCNRKPLLKECLRALCNQTYPKDHYEVIVVDDGSTDGTREAVNEVIRQSDCRIRYIAQENLGPAAARNNGIRTATGEIVAFTDDDCVADEHWLTQLVACIVNSNGVAGVEGKIVMAGDKTPFTRLVETGGPGGHITANIAYLRKVLFDVGLFDGQFAGAGAEDTELGYRVLDSGREILFCEAALVVHAEANESLSQFVSTTRYYWRAYLQLYRKHPNRFRKDFGGIGRFFTFRILISPIVRVRRWWRYLVAHPRMVLGFFARILFQSAYGAYILVTYPVFKATHDRSKTRMTGNVPRPE